MLVSDLVSPALVAAAIAPALLLLWLVVAADSRPEPPRAVLIAVALGALSAIVAVVLEVWLPQLYHVGDKSWLGVGTSTLLFVGIPEETVKILIIAALALRARDFDEPMDGVVYGTAVGLGFAALENFFYLVNADKTWASVAVMRGVLSVPFHGALGAIAGAYIARARFGGALGAQLHDRWRRPRLLLSAWLIPVLLHTLFDAPLFALKNISPDTSDGALEILAMLLMGLVVGFGTITFAVRLARRIARHQKVGMQSKRLPPAHWRSIWGRCAIGVGSSFVALPLVIAGQSGAKILGAALLVISVGIAWKCARFLNDTAIRRHPSSVAPAG
jgi:protease PrsW